MSSKKIEHDEVHVFLKISKLLPLYFFPSLIKCDSILPLLYEKNHINGIDNQHQIQHINIMCNGCGCSPIIGTLYKCINCQNFNLCGDCEGHIEHFSLHIFVCIKYPLSSLESKFPINTDYHNTISYNGRPLWSIFSLLSSSQNLSIDLMLLACRVLEHLSYQYTSTDVYMDIFKHPKFGQFLANIAAYPDLFLRNAVLHMIETLCNIKTYGYKKINESLIQIQSFLKEEIIELLTKRISESSSNFLLELLFIVTSNINISLIRKSPLISNFFNIIPSLLNFLELFPLTSTTSARAWCLVFRIFLISSDTTDLIKLPGIINIIRCAIKASYELQV